MGICCPRVPGPGWNGIHVANLNSERITTPVVRRFGRPSAGTPQQQIILRADSTDELNRGIDALAIDIPPRGPKRNTASCEQWQIHHLLRCLQAVEDELHLPLRLSKRESPDFRLQSGTRIIGIENTEAINSDYVKATMHPRVRQDGCVIDPSLYKWGDTGRPRRQIAQEAGRKRLSGPGWVSDSVEREFAQSVVDEVRRKQLKLASYERYDSDRLLIYHNHPSPCIDIESAIEHTRRALADHWATPGFDTVYVHKYRWMLAFSKDQSRVLYEFPSSEAPPGFDHVAWTRLDDTERLYLKTLEHESDFALLHAMQCRHCAPEHPLGFEDDFTDLHEDWLQARYSDLSGAGYRGFLSSDHPNRLRTASEIGKCRTAVGLFRDGPLRYVCIVLTHNAEEVMGWRHSAVPRFPNAKSTIAAILGYLATLTHIQHWASDAQASSKILRDDDCAPSSSQSLGVSVPL